jgi:hypothetical protein
MRTALFMAILLLAGPGPAAAGGAGGAGGERLPFGFRALEIFKASPIAFSLHAADLNADGLPDLIVADNAEAMIRLLIQRQPGEAAGEAPDAGSGPATVLSAASSTVLNEIPSDPRFRLEKFYTETHVVSLAVGDFDGDRRPDLAYSTDPPELEIVYQAENWGARRRKLEVRDGAESPHALAAADLDHDGHDDLALLGKGKTYLFHQRDGELREPTVIHASTADAWDLDLTDLDGDGRLDLVHVVPGSERPVVVRLSRESGFGPEMAPLLKSIKSWCFAPLSPPPAPDSKPRATVLTIQGSTGRLKAYVWDEKEAVSGLASARIVPLRAEGEPRERQSRFGDVDLDGRLDLLVSYPDTAQLEVFFQDAGGELSRAVTYPTLAGVNGLEVADLDGDGRKEVIVTSATEKAVGVSRFEEGRLRIPETWPLEKEPVLLAAAPLRRGEGERARDRLFIVSKAEKGYELEVFSLAAPEGAAPAAGADGADGASADGASAGGASAGGARPALESEAAVPLAGKGSAPSGLRPLDADGDGATDLLLWVPYEDPYLYRQGAGGEGLTWSDVSREPGFGIGQLSKLEPAAVSTLGPGEGAAGDRLLVAQGRYARVLGLEAGGRLRVIEQLSARGANSKLEAAIAIDLDQDGVAEVAVLDAASAALDLYRRGQAGGYELRDRVEIPKLEVLRLEVRDLSGDGRDDLVLVGKSSLAILESATRDGGLEEAWTFAVDREKDLGLPQDLAVGDLNGDGAADVIVPTAPRHNLLFLSRPHGPQADGGAAAHELAFYFPVFEEKSYMSRGSVHGPREMLAADVDRDGLEDLLLLIHDRILLYLQDRTP